jgi:hypothetical protein
MENFKSSSSSTCDQIQDKPIYRPIGNSKSNPARFRSAVHQISDPMAVARWHDGVGSKASCHPGRSGNVALDHWMVKENLGNGVMRRRYRRYFQIWNSRTTNAAGTGGVCVTNASMHRERHSEGFREEAALERGKSTVLRICNG